MDRFHSLSDEEIEAFLAGNINDPERYRSINEALASLARFDQIDYWFRCRINISKARQCEEFDRAFEAAQKFHEAKKKSDELAERAPTLSAFHECMREEVAMVAEDLKSRLQRAEPLAEEASSSSPSTTGHEHMREGVPLAAGTGSSSSTTGHEHMREELPPNFLSEEEGQRWYHGWRSCDNDADSMAFGAGSSSSGPEKEKEKEIELEYLCNHSIADFAKDSDFSYNDESSESPKRRRLI